MKLFKILLVLLLGPVLIANAQKIITIKGSITGDTKGKNRVFITDLNAYRDTAIVKNGQFSFSSPLDLTKPLVINFECEMGYKPYTIINDQPGTIDLNLNLQDNTLNISGLKTAVIYNEFRRKNAEMYRSIDQELAGKYGTAFPKKGDPNFNVIMLERSKLSAEKMVALLKQQVAKYPDAYATAYILADNTPRYPLILQEELYKGLSAAAKSTVKGKELYAMIQGTKNSAIGNQVANFTLKNAIGQPISFDQFKGKYVLIDFWASWCGPCRASFPHMKKVYKAFHQKGLEIYSISVDKNPADWQKALSEEQLPWLQAIDHDMLAKTRFAVSNIPNLFLIAPDGKVVMKELGFNPAGGGAIEKKLEEIYGNNIE